MKNYFHFLFAISFSLSNTFSGYVLDEESGNPIENVEIVLSSNKELISKEEMVNKIKKCVNARTDKNF